MNKKTDYNCGTSLKKKEHYHEIKNLKDFFSITAEKEKAQELNNDSEKWSKNNQLKIVNPNFRNLTQKKQETKVSAKAQKVNIV